MPFLENRHLIELKEIRTLDNTTNFGMSKLSQFDELLHNFEKTADTGRSRRLNLSIDSRLLSEGIIKDTTSAELKQPEKNVTRVASNLNYFFSVITSNIMQQPKKLNFFNF